MSTKPWFFVACVEYINNSGKKINFWIISFTVDQALYNFQNLYHFKNILVLLGKTQTSLLKLKEISGAVDICLKHIRIKPTDRCHLRLVKTLNVISTFLSQYISSYSLHAFTKGSRWNGRYRKRGKNIFVRVFLQWKQIVEQVFIPLGNTC